MWGSLSTLLVLTSLVASQRPFFAGNKPIGFPDTPNRTTTTTDGLVDRFGETTTQRLPIEANGDRDLIDRLSKLPIDKQPFWFINWQALEEHRKKPQTYPQRPNGFVDRPPTFSNNQGLSSQGSSNPSFVPAQSFSNSQGFSAPSSGLSPPNVGFQAPNTGFSNNGISRNDIVSTNTINGVVIPELSSSSNAANFNNNPGFLNPNAGNVYPNNGFVNPNAGPSRQGPINLNNNFSNQNPNFNTDQRIPNQGPVLINRPVFQNQNPGNGNVNPNFSTQNPGNFNSHSASSVTINSRFSPQALASVPGVIDPVTNAKYTSTSYSTSSATNNKYGEPPSSTNPNSNYSYNWNNSYHHATFYNLSYNTTYKLPYTTTRPIQTYEYYSNPV